MSVRQKSQYKRWLANYVLTTLTKHKHTGPVRLELVRHSIGRRMDEDNLVSTGKIPIDALVEAGVIPDDKPEIITERSYSQTRALKKEGQMTVIRIIDLPLP